jgi:hypothetical protein
MKRQTTRNRGTQSYLSSCSLDKSSSKDRGAAKGCLMFQTQTLRNPTLRFFYWIQALSRDPKDSGCREGFFIYQRNAMKKNEILFKLVCFVNRDELDMLDNISKDIFFSTGRKMPRSQLLREIIKTFDSLYNFKKDEISIPVTKGGPHA